MYLFYLNKIINKFLKFIIEQKLFLDHILSKITGTMLVLPFDKFIRSYNDGSKMFDD